MPRLVAYGPSTSYGHGLPDCYVDGKAGSKPSEFAWPSLLASMLDFECLNLSQLGAGNTQILWKLLNTELREDDLVILSWTHFDRLEFFRFQYNNVDGIRVDPSKYDPRFMEEESVFTENTNIKNLLTMNYASMYLRERGIKSYAFFGAREIRAKQHPAIVISNYDPEFSCWPYHVVDDALDGQHFGLKSHENIAKALYNKICHTLMQS